MMAKRLRSEKPAHSNVINILQQPPSGTCSSYIGLVTTPLFFLMERPCGTGAGTTKEGVFVAPPRRCTFENESYLAGGSWVWVEPGVLSGLPPGI
jgi:hypothetical protein